MKIDRRKNFKTPQRERKVSEEGVVSEQVENQEGGHDCTIQIPKLNLRSKEKFKKYNGPWMRTGSIYLPINKKE